MNDRATVSSWIPAERAEEMTDRARLYDCADHRTSDDIYEIIGTAETLRPLLPESENLAGPLSEMVVILPRCIAEIAGQMGRVDLPEYQAMLKCVAQMERVLVSYASAD